METSTLKYATLTIFKGIIITLAFLFILTKCGGYDNKIIDTNKTLFAKIKNDSLILTILAKDLTTSERINDSLTLVKSKAEIVYIKSSSTVRTEIKQGICDTVKVLVALNNCDSVIAYSNLLIAQKDTTINILKSTVATQNDMMTISRNIINNQDKSFRKSIRKQKVKTVMVIIGATILEGLTIFALR